MKNFLKAFGLYLAFVAAAFWLISAHRAKAQELRTTGHFDVAFTALSDSGRREHFVVPMDADSEIQCMMGAFMAATHWIVDHPSYSAPRDVHCAKSGEADL